eukprot:29934-Pelagomonas_calceolata.AAC.1
MACTCAFASRTELVHTWYAKECTILSDKVWGLSRCACLMELYAPGNGLTSLHGLKAAAATLDVSLLVLLVLIAIAAGP